MKAQVMILGLWVRSAKRGLLLGTQLVDFFTIIMTGIILLAFYVFFLTGAAKPSTLTVQGQLASFSTTQDILNVLSGSNQGVPVLDLAINNDGKKHKARIEEALATVIFQQQAARVVAFTGGQVFSPEYGVNVADIAFEADYGFKAKCIKGGPTRAAPLLELPIPLKQTMHTLNVDLCVPT